MSEYRSRTEKRRAQETARKGNKNGKKRGEKKRGAFKKVVVSALIVMLVGIIGGTATAVAMISNAPPIDADELVFAEGSTIYDQNDNEVLRLQGTENRTYRDISEMPEQLKDAFIAVEDYRFYDHMGIDVRRIGGAIAANITEGFGAEGASTITQQLVKQAFLSTDQTIERKVQEQWLSVRMEQQYSKDEILEMYLNINYFDESAWGVGEAAIRYFNKEDLSELTIADSAVLAAIPRRPSFYNPESNPENAEERRNLVISLMEEQELITGDEAAEARDVDIEDQLDYTPAEDEGMYESFVDQVMDEVENIEGIESADLYAAGFDIYTTLDPDAQAYAEDVIQTDDYIAHYPDNEDFQIGFTLLDTETGALRAMVGNRQETDEQRGWNHAARGGGQPGSTIKPLLDYGPAIDYQQWSTGEPLVDEPHSYNDANETEVTNYGGGYSGEVTMREALVRSLNVPAVKAIQEVGTDNAQAFAEGIGLEFEEVHEAYALGGTEEEVNSLDMAGAYAAFGNDGVYNEPHAVRKIEFRDGREIEFSPESERAMNDYTAYMISDVLKGVVSDSSGTGQRANVEGLPLAGKTGTSNFDQEERQSVPDGAVPDVWFNGYTTNYTAAVWAGHTNRGDGYLAAGEEQQIARDIFRIIMSNVHEGEETADFSQPDSVCESEMEEGSGQLPSEFTPSNEISTELFVCGNEPQETSDTYEVDASISGLDATYDEEDEEIVVSWDFPEEEADDATFSVSHDPGDGMSEVADSDEQEYVLSDPETGDHNFEVVAMQDGNTIDTAETSVEVPEGVEEDEDDSDEDDDEEGRSEDDDEDEDEDDEGDEDEDAEDEDAEEDEDSEEDEENDEDGDEDGEDDDDESDESSGDDDEDDQEE
ncbi:PBP1A family penicillin-binding protein [Salicibibacter cibarius]|uniref:PBP1A family penicillin-binding protein n=1 Tax=Salicibibacter cibarius TaxID=2743000 RepID=A0A7T7CBP8_9BACI|nr:PBP1A family penicillin-binding protein [Salicibibacter cibarius]QQK76054.1 PBP1A family penicillin-binding protein [Salicibibacter cibarius]